MSFDTYRWLLLQIIKWWTVFAFIVLGLILACILFDWVARVGWGYPAWSLPFVVGFLVVVWIIRRLAIRELRRL